MDTEAQASSSVTTRYISFGGGVLVSVLASVFQPLLPLLVGLALLFIGRFAGKQENTGRWLALSAAGLGFVAGSVLYFVVALLVAAFGGAASSGSGSS